jgi:hypothetical protein
LSEIVNHYGLGAVRLCTHGLPNLDTRCPYCERDELWAALAQHQERAESLSRELLDAIRARDSYRASADLRFGMGREFEALLGCGDTTGDAAFERGLIRLRELVAGEKELAEFGEILSRHNHEWSERCELAESRAERLEEALREIERKTGHFGEAPPPPEWMPMLSLIAWVGRCARAALGEEGK